MGFTNDDGDDDDDDDDDIEGDYDKDAGDMAAWDMPKSPYDAVFRKRVGGLGGTPLKHTGLEDLNKNLLLTVLLSRRIMLIVFQILMQMQ